MCSLVGACFLVGDSPLYRVAGSWTSKARLATLGLSRNTMRRVALQHGFGKRSLVDMCSLVIDDS